MASIHLQLLGRFLVRRDDAEIPPADFGGRKVRTLLRVLAVRRPDLVPHDALADALWSQRLPANPAANLGVLVNRARRALGDPTLIVTGSGGYALGDCAVDAAEFLARVAQARGAAAAGDQPGVLRAASAALALWGEPLAEDTYAPWAREPRDRLLRARVDALELAAGAALALGDPGSAVAMASDVVTIEPLRESAALVLARALAAAGDRAGALARLAQLRALLADELGVDLSAEAAELQLALLRGAGPDVRPRTSVPPLPSRPPQQRWDAFAGLAFVGRDGELTRLQAAVAGRDMVALAGVAGVGKSRLLAEVTRGSLLPVLAVRAYLPERAEAWGLARSLLREALAADATIPDMLPAPVRAALAGLLPEFADGAPPADFDGETRRALLLTAGLRVLEAAAGEGAVLVADDLQWADPSSLVLLGSVLARLPQLAAVLAYRPDELAPGVLDDLRGTRQLTELRLGPLPADAVTALVGDPELAAALLAGTDATPFAVAEVLRELVERGALAPTAGGGWVARSPAVADLAAELGRDGQRRGVRRRADRQTGASAEVLRLVALVARQVPATTVAQAAGLGPREVLEALSGLDAAGLLWLGEHGWAVAHDLVGETVVADLGAGERGKLHSLLARALQAEDADPSEVARHHRDAGDVAEAAVAYCRAAQQALDSHATREAVTLAGSGLALDPRPLIRAELLDLRAQARAPLGEFAAALTDLQEALADTPPGPGRAGRLARLAMLTSGAQDLPRAGELAELAVVEAGADDAALAVALETASILDMNLARPDRAADRAEEALARYRRLGDGRGVARVLDGRAMATFLDGRITEGVEVLGRVAQLFTDSGDLLRVITPRSTRGHGLVFLARPAEGLAQASAALELARQLDAPEGQMYALWHRSEALSGLGRAAEAEAEAREALGLALAADHRGWTATSWRAVGIALQVRGVLDEAAAAFSASAAAAGDALTLFASWAAARGALMALAQGRAADAEPLVQRALTIGPPLGHYEARLAQVELAAARGAADLTALARAALASAHAGGHAVSVPRLAELA